MTVLETPRLVLRPFRNDDLDAFAAIYGDPEAMRFLGDGRPMNLAETWRHMAMMVGHWELRGFGMWAVVEKASGSVVGRIGFWEPEGWPGFELGWALARPQWGKGFAGEGARRALEHSFTTLGRDRVISLIDPANLRSIRVAERIGETLEGSTEVGGREALVYAIARDAWAARSATT